MENQIADSNRRDPVRKLETHRYNGLRDGGVGGGASVPLRHVLRLVVGPAGVVDPQRDLPSGDQDRRLRLRRQLKHVHDFRHRPVVPLDALPHARVHLLLLLGLDPGYGNIRGVPFARDQRRAYRFHC